MKSNCLNKPSINSHHGGFVAILSVIVVSIILLGSAVARGTSQFYARSNGLNKESKSESRALASSCAYFALEKIRYDFSYSPGIGGEVVMVGSDTCTILSVKNDPEDAVTHNRDITIVTKAGVRGTFTVVEVKGGVHNPAYIQGNPSNPRIIIDAWIEL